MRSNCFKIFSAFLVAGLASLAPAQSITTLFAGGNGLSGNSGCFFDIDVTNPAGLMITGFDVNCMAVANTPFELEIYTAPRTYVGNEQNAAAWTLVTSGLSVSNGRDIPTPVTTRPFLLPMGQYGIYVYNKGAGHSYTNATATNSFHSNNDLALTLGASASGLFTSSPIASRVWNGTIHYRPASGLHANFDADVTVGAAPLRVQFSDKTFTSDPGGVTSWAWDLTGDTRVDATIQNPIWTYPTQGRTVSYDVTLTVTDASHPQSILAKRNYITVDPPPKADFDANPRGGAIRPGGPPLIVRFTDLSIGATAWAWDLNGNTQVDSTAQNPVYPYISGGNYSITLAVTGVGGNDRITKTDFIVVTDTPQITTMFAGNTSVGGMPAGCFFDINVKNPAGIWITSFDVNCTSANQALDLEVYVTPGSYIGNEQNPALWTLVSTGKALSNARNTPTPVETGDFFLPMGTYGIFIVHYGITMSYASTGQTFYSNADVDLTLGAVMGSLFASNPLSPRFWNGTLYYITPGWPKFGPYSEGCRGSNGVPALAPAVGSIPRIGTTFILNLSSMPTAGGSALALIGLSKSAFGPVPLPFDLGPLGAPGCRLLTSIRASIGVANVGGLGSLGLPIPNDPVLVGGYLTTQALVIDPTANSMGLTVTNAGEMHLGN